MKWKLGSAAVVSCLTAGLLSSAPSLAQDKRPEIVGISHMSVYTTNAEGARHFYGDILGGAKGADPQDAQGVRFYFSPTQFVEVLPLPAQHTISRMARVSYRTANAAALRQYLTSHGVKQASDLASAGDGSHWFRVKDAEGNEIEFFQDGKAPVLAAGAKPIGTRIIHVGYLVHSRADEDQLYKTLLGFRPYWSGAMKPDKVDWVSQQVPNGHDWLEYMLVGDGSTTTLASVDQNHLGVLNHFSIGVPNMEQAVTTLLRDDRESPRHDGPQMGKDGKWQANLYDPDGTRVELMEFQPVMKPCCSPFLAESPRN